MNSHYLSREQIATLVTENEELREQVRQLQDLIRPQVTVPREWGLAPMEADLLLAIRAASPGVCNRGRAIQATYGSSDAAPFDGVIDVRLSNLRRKMRAADPGIVIETVWGRGWRMSPAAMARFDEAVSANPALRVVAA